MSIETIRANDEVATTHTLDLSFVPTKERLDETKLLKFDPARFEEGIKIWAGSMRTQMLAEGYSSVEELMDDLRGRE